MLHIKPETFQSLQALDFLSVQLHVLCPWAPFNYRQYMDGPSASQMSFNLTHLLSSTFLLPHSAMKLMDVCFGLSAWLNVCIISWLEYTSEPASYLCGGFIYCVYMCRINNQIRKAYKIEQL